MLFKKYFLEEKEKFDIVKSIIDENEYVFFFIYMDQIYASDEENRIIYSQIKDPSKDMPIKWADEANFIATNLSKKVKGENYCQNMFIRKDINKIRIISKDEAEKTLMKQAKSNTKDKNIIIINKDSKDKDVIKEIE